MLQKTIRFAAIALAVLLIGLSLLGIFGSWFVDRKATDVALKGFGLIEVGIGVVDAGVSRVNELIATSRTEVRQASETITAAGAQAQANSPVLNALNERLETSLAPRIAQMQQVLAPVRDALGSVGNAVSLLNSITDDGRPCSAIGGAGRRLLTGSKGCPRTRRNCAAHCAHWWSRRATSPLRPLPRSKGLRSASTPGLVRRRQMFTQCVRTWRRCRSGWTSESRDYCSY